LPDLEWRSPSSAGDVATRAAVVPLHDVDHDQGLEDKHVSQLHTMDIISFVSDQFKAQFTHILLLFVDVTNLKPDVCLAQRLWRVLDNVLKALEMLALALRMTFKKSMCLPRDSVDIWTVVCRLFPDGSRSHSPCRILVPCA